MFLTLLRKELRLLRPVLVAAAAIAFFFEALLPAVTTVTRGPSERFSGLVLAQNVGQDARYAAMLTAGLAAVFACAAITTERRERWADLVAMLPIGRGRRLLATAVAGGVAWSACFALHAAVLLAWWHLFELPGERAYQTQPNGHRIFHSTAGLPAYALAVYAAMAVAMFGLAWLAAALLRSPTIASALPVATVVGTSLITNELHGAVEPRDGSPLLVVFIAAPLAVGAIATAAGTLIALRRVEP